MVDQKQVIEITLMEWKHQSDAERLDNLFNWYNDGSLSHILNFNF